MSIWRRREFLGAGLAALAAGARSAGAASDPPARAWALLDSGEIRLRRSRDGRWEGGGVSVALHAAGDATRISIAAPGVALRSVTLTWRDESNYYRVLNDHWERTYGDVGWQKVSTELQLPWYFLGQHVDGVEAWGVRTGGAALCSWRLDGNERQLVIDTTSGGVGVNLGARVLEAADVVHAWGGHVSDVFGVLRAFTQKMCPAPRALSQPVYGINDWYFAYGKNSDALIRQHTEMMAPLAEGLANRPFSVIDAGWFVGPSGAPDDCCFGRDMQTTNARFADMGALAANIRKLGMRPGLWTRPLCGDSSTPETLRLPRIAGRDDPARPILDPTIPENAERVAQYFAQYRRWNFDLVKIDFTTFDLLGKWGFEMIRDRELTPRGWRLHDSSRTNAEIIRDLYATMRRAAGDTLLIGCNTLSHLSAGVFEINRIGDDTSGREWDRTRKMGVNALAFRGAHHGHFYAADADCVGLTTRVPWEKNRQWMELVAKSGTPLFVSAQPDAVGAEQKAAIRDAFARAAHAQPVTRPVDWLSDAWPRKWEFGDEVASFDWGDAPAAQSG